MSSELLPWFWGWNGQPPPLSQSSLFPSTFRWDGSYQRWQVYDFPPGKSSAPFHAKRSRITTNSEQLFMLIWGNFSQNVGPKYISHVKRAHRKNNWWTSPARPVWHWRKNIWNPPEWVPGIGHGRPDQILFSKREWKRGNDIDNAGREYIFVFLCFWRNEWLEFVKPSPRMSSYITFSEVKFIGKLLRSHTLRLRYLWMKINSFSLAWTWKTFSLHEERNTKFLLPCASCTNSKQFHLYFLITKFVSYNNAKFVEPDMTT